MATDNRALGRFMLDGILPAPRGLPQVEVTFDIDANGILNVRAQDKGTGKEQKITITASSGLSKEEVEKMQKEAEMHAAEDTKRREEIEAKNMADTLAYTAEKTNTDRFRYRYTQRLQYETDEGFYTTGQINLDHALSENNLLRWSNRKRVRMKIDRE